MISRPPASPQERAAFDWLRKKYGNRVPEEIWDYVGNPSFCIRPRESSPREASSNTAVADLQHIATLFASGGVIAAVETARPDPNDPRPIPCVRINIASLCENLESMKAFHTADLGRKPSPHIIPWRGGRPGTAPMEEPSAWVEKQVAALNDQPSHLDAVEDWPPPMNIVGFPRRGRVAKQPDWREGVPEAERTLLVMKNICGPNIEAVRQDDGVSRFIIPLPPVGFGGTAFRNSGIERQDFVDLLAHLGADLSTPPTASQKNFSLGTNTLVVDAKTCGDHVEQLENLVAEQTESRQTSGASSKKDLEPTAIQHGHHLRRQRESQNALNQAFGLNFVKKDRSDPDGWFAIALKRGYNDHTLVGSSGKSLAEVKSILADLQIRHDAVLDEQGGEHPKTDNRLVIEADGLWRNLEAFKQAFAKTVEQAPAAPSTTLFSGDLADRWALKKTSVSENSEKGGDPAPGR